MGCCFSTSKSVDLPTVPPPAHKASVPTVVDDTSSSNVEVKAQNLGITNPALEED